VPTVVPLALGTGNDWARSLALPRDPVALAAVIRRDAAVPHDAGRIELLASTGVVRETCWFINVAGAGFDAHVIERMPARTPSRLAYLLSALRDLVHYRSPEFRLGLAEPGDGDAIRMQELQGRLLLAFVANGRYCGGGMHVAPTALPDDGRFDVVTIAALNLWQALPRIARLYSGSLLQDSAVQRRVAARVRIDSDPPSGIEADGQFVGHTPAIFSVERGVLRTLRGDR
jgi:diacylglycerol kinase family enzyme